MTALHPVLGDETSAASANEALATNGSVYDLVLHKGWLTQAALDDLLQPEHMTAPCQGPSRAVASIHREFSGRHRPPARQGRGRRTDARAIDARRMPSR